MRRNADKLFIIWFYVYVGKIMTPYSNLNLKKTFLNILIIYIDTLCTEYIYRITKKNN